MLEFAQRELTLSAVQADGATLRQHLEVHQRSTGITPELLEEVEVPKEAMYLWYDFIEMNRRRGAGVAGPAPISEEGVLAFAARRGFSFSPWENQVLDCFEALYVAHYSGKQQSQEEEA